MPQPTNSPTPQSIEQEAEAWARWYANEGSYKDWLKLPTSPFGKEGEFAKTLRVAKAGFLAGASAHSVPESGKGGMRWISAIEKPQTEGYYKGNHIVDERELTFHWSGEDWYVIHEESECKIPQKSVSEYRYLAESTPPQPLGDVKILLDALDKITKYIGDVGAANTAREALSSYQSKNKGGGE